MKNKRFLLWINLVLGSLSMFLVGCHTQKKAAQATQPENDTQVEQAAEGDRVVCKYGVPAEMYERPTRKYGTPDMREKE